MSRFVSRVLAFAFAFAAGSAAAQQTLTVWFTKAFYPAEEQALNDVIKKYEAKSGVKVDLSLYSPEDVVTKSVAAVEAGNPPDVGFGFTYDFRVTGKWAYEGKLENLDDIIKPIASQFLPGPLSTTWLMNGKTGKKAYYAAPVEMQLMHIEYWIDMLQDAGYKESDIPNDWKGFWSFWCDKVQPALRAKGQRVYAIGHPASVQASDTFYSFHMFMNAYDVQVVDEDGKLTLDQPKNRAGLVKALADYAAIVKKGCSPASSVNWTDVDNNLNFANKTTVMTHNATISIPAAQFDAMNRATSTAGAKSDGAHQLLREDPHPRFSGQGDRRPPAAARRSEDRSRVRRCEKQGTREGVPGVPAGGRQPAAVRRGLARPLGAGHEARLGCAVLDRRQGPAPQGRPAAGLAGTRVLPVRLQLEVHVVNAENVWGRATARIAKDNVPPEKAADELIARIKQILAQ